MDFHLWNASSTGEEMDNGAQPSFDVSAKSAWRLPGNFAKGESE
jgi:hypothetical protein